MNATASDNSGQRFPIEKDPTIALVNWAMSLKYEHLAPGIIETIKMLIFDTVIASLPGGKCSHGVSDIVKTLTASNSPKESTVIGYGCRVSQYEAAFINGILARAADLDEVQNYAGHTAAYILPPMLAAAEVGKAGSGKEFIAAYAAGAEISARIKYPTRSTPEALQSFAENRAYFPTPAKFGAPLSIAKMMGKNAETAARAIGISFTVQGTWHNTHYAPGTDMVYVEHGFASENALKSVYLADVGITAPTSVLFGSGGAYARFCPWAENTDNITAELGQKWFYYPGCLFKFLSSAATTQPPAIGARSLMDEHALLHSDIAAVICEVSPFARTFTVEPRDQKWNPKNREEAVFSMPYVVATMAVKGRCFVQDFTEEELSNQDVRELMKKIEIAFNPDFVNEHYLDCTVTIRLKNGNDYKKTFEKYRPESWDRLMEKAELCAHYAPHEIAPSKLKTLADVMRDLDGQDTLEPLLNAIRDL